MSMFADTTTVLIKDLRFALEVMEDRSHLGLGAERAAKLRTLMQRRISAAEEALIEESGEAHSDRKNP
jgi:hypothetical protein